jgi:hypothetical protein
MLSNAQTEELFTFCNKHFVPFYDLQVELVDHLANAIEQKMEADKNISFEKALAEVYAGFGALGFSSFVNSRSSLLEKQYSMSRRKLFWAYFTWPKAAVTICLFLLFSVPYNFLDSEALGIYVAVLTFVITIYELIIIKKIRRKQRKVAKPLMIIGAHHSSFIFTIILFEFLIPSRFHLFEVRPINSLWMYEILIVTWLIVLLCIFAWRDTARTMYAKAVEQFPELFA